MRTRGFPLECNIRKNDRDLHRINRDPHRIELPSLSSLERLTMEFKGDAKRKLGFDLAKVADSKLGVDPIVVFKQFYRLYPHFSRVEL